MSSRGLGDVYKRQLAQQAIATSLARDVAAVDTNVDRQSTAIQIAIANDGEKTRALITNNQIAELNQRLTVAQLENVENRAIQREQNNSHNMTVTVNQALTVTVMLLSLIHISEPTRRHHVSRMPSSA